jgi:hypothetical protein
MSKCAICITEINLDDEGGHIYPDGAVVCATCEEYLRRVNGWDFGVKNIATRNG